MSRNKRRGRMTLAKKIERDLRLQAEEERRIIRENALYRAEVKEAPSES